MPELPDEKLARLMSQYGLNYHDASVVMESNTQQFFEEVMKINLPKVIPSLLNKPILEFKVNYK